ncbi:MAG: helix-turn-helix transcriptional regulator [Alphaproteobacteria bacterium]
MLKNDRFSDRLLQAINAIETQTDKFGVFDVVKSFSEFYGFTHVTVGQLVHPSLQDMDYAELGVSNYPAEFQSEYIKENFLLHDPVINRALVSEDAFAWADLLPLANRRGQKVFEMSRQYGLDSGVTVPIHLHDRTPGIVSYAGQDCDVSASDIEALELVAIHGYSKLLDIYDAGKQAKRVKLTPREVDVLHYVACGKTDSEIAHLLTLGRYSVKDHLTNARKKLGAANRAHCVVIAIRDGHIIL